MDRLYIQYQYLGSGGRRCCSTAPYGESSECRINFLSSLSRPHCLSCWTTSAWWRPLAPPTGWLIRTLLCASGRFSSPQPRRPGGLEEEREEEQRDWARVRKLRVPWILSGTSRHCTTCCSCGQVRTTFQRRIHPASVQSVALKSTIDTPLSVRVCLPHQCQHNGSQQRTTYPPFRAQPPWGTSVPLSWSWLRPWTRQKRGWCPVGVEADWPGWKAPHQSIGTLETGASADETFCRDRKRIMTRWQEVRVTQVNSFVWATVLLQLKIIN